MEGVAVPYHLPVTIAGNSYDLAHLDPVIFDTESAKLGRTVRTWCWFTTHTFSRKCEAAETAPDILDEGRRPRMLCPDRYALSFHLPTAVAQLAEPRRYVWETAAERNWLHRAEVMVTAFGAMIAYQVFFAVKKAPKGAAYDVEMVVESAYAFDPLRTPKVRGRALFAGLLTATVEGRPLHTQGARRKQ